MKTASPLKDKQILIVEDMPENLRLLRAILRLEDAIVLEAERAITGIEMARNQQPDLILMDMQMPEMDGLTATKILCADPQTRDIPIVIVSASAMQEDLRRAYEAGCSGYITKPIDPLTVARQLAAFLPGTSAT